ncbi:MAG: TlpA disulfide reductase family protein [Chloroflexota bacterium]
MMIVLSGCGNSAQPSTEAASSTDMALSIADESRVLERADEPPEVGEMAPDFQFTMEDGTTAKLSEFQGQKVVLNFWATWCLPCREEMPHLEEIVNEHDGTVVVLGVNKLETIDAVRPFAEELQVSFPLIVNDTGDISDRYGIRNLPTSYFINTDGTVAGVESGDIVLPYKLGIMDYEALEEQIDTLH